MGAKSEQLQIRVSREQKAALRRLAREAGLDVSSYVLARAIPHARVRFAEAVETLGSGGEHRFALAEVNDLLARLTAAQLEDAVGTAPPGLQSLSLQLRNYLAAMVEQACDLHGAAPPPWTRTVSPLEAPHFATPLRSLRLHLLRAAPVVFRRRNIFVDAGIGARV